ncbi:aldehyde dehydrogenase family protein [Desulfosediminicola sp.]|uniref:aldehyde dehydrogenase family protein n=1 Tax=Desulfosediminicola sp. TaxID=2886825 RepID=UPI003AF2568C
MIVDNDLLSIQHARILAENAVEAQKKLATFSQDKLDAIVTKVAEAVAGEAHALAVMSAEETDGGRWQDKLAKNRFVCTAVVDRFMELRCVGVIAEDCEAETRDIGVPVGVIVALCPVTSPVSTTIYKALMALKSGNAIIFSPHPLAAKSISHTLELIIETAEASGLPEGCISYLKPVSKSGTAELMNHPATALVMVTGVPGMLASARTSGKPVIYGGTGNGPAFIERSANIDQAVRDIISSKTFDNGIAPSAEQSIVVDACIAEDVRSALRRNNAYFMSEKECEALAGLFFRTDGTRRHGVVGLSAQTLAKRAGFSIPAETTLLIAERNYVAAEDPYSRELLSPVLALYVEADWLDACEKCIELLLHERNSHTLVIHSGDEGVIHQFAMKKPVGRLLVNTPAAFGGMGATTNLFPSMILGSGSAGHGITSDNVSPRNLIYVRKVGYGVRGMNSLTGASVQYENKRPNSAASRQLSDSDKEQAIRQILSEAIKALSAPANK